MSIISEIIDGKYPPKPDLEPCTLCPTDEPKDLLPSIQDWARLIDRKREEARELIAKQFDVTELFTAPAQPEPDWEKDYVYSPVRYMEPPRYTVHRPPPIRQPEVLDLTCSYMKSVHKPEVLLERAKILIPEDLEYDTLVGTGLSGTIAVTELARKLDKDYLVVRKENDGSHSYLPVEGRLGKRWLFVDDVVASGRTFARAYTKVTRIAREKNFDTEFVGTLLYADEQYIKPNECHHRWLTRHEPETYRGELAGPDGDKASWEL